MGYENILAGLSPKVLEAAIEQQYVQAATGKALLYLNPVTSDVVEQIYEDSTRGGFDFIDKDGGISPILQTAFKKKARTIEPFSARIEITDKEVRTNPNLVRTRINVAGTQWADYEDKLVYGTFERDAGLETASSELTAWGEAGATPVSDISYALSEIADTTGLEPDTLVLSNKAFHYLATNAGLMSQQTYPTGANAYVLTGKLSDILGMRIIRTKNAGDNAYVLRAGDCGKWDEFVAPTIKTFTEFYDRPTLYSIHSMLEWGAPSLSLKKLVYKLEGVGAAPTN